LAHETTPPIPNSEHWKLPSDTPEPQVTFVRSVQMLCRQ
jgi:hypothetical protein